MAAEGRRLADMQVLFETLRTYFGVQVAGENLNVMTKAVSTAEEDLSRAQALYDAGMVTEADLLAIKVHLAALREEEIRAENGYKVMQAELNQTLGEPLDAEFRLLTPLEYHDTRKQDTNLDALVVSAVENQPAAKMKALELESVRLKKKMAHADFLPSLAFQAGWESNRESFLGSGGTNWMVGLAMQINLFEGTGKFARASEAAAGLKKAEAEKQQADDAIRLEVRKAFLDREAASERVEVASTAVAQARESHRITEARYEGGLANVTDLLRSQNALLGAEARYLGAVYAGRLAEARLELAVGTLHKESEAVKP
jgi:outer membrane protein TolC